MFSSPVVALQQARVNMAAVSSVVQAAARARASVAAPGFDLDPANTASYNTLNDKGLRLAGHHAFVFLSKHWNDAVTYFCHMLTSEKVKLPLGHSGTRLLMMERWVACLI